jgi:hypothetical protein
MGVPLVTYSGLCHTPPNDLHCFVADVYVRPLVKGFEVSMTMYEGNEDKSNERGNISERG